MDFRREIANRITTPLIPLISKTGVTPDILTWIGFFINVVAAVMVALNHLIVGGILMLVSGFFDILDGALARYIQKPTKFGGLLDSTLDRLSEAVLFFGLLILYGTRGDVLILALIFAALIFSFLISYIRARAEGLGLDCKVGFFTRTERVIVMALGLIFNLVLVALIILIIFSFITVVQRLVYVYKITRTR